MSEYLDRAAVRAATGWSILATGAHHNTPSYAVVRGGTYVRGYNLTRDAAVRVYLARIKEETGQ